jgi:hypothetical protein
VRLLDKRPHALTLALTAVGVLLVAGLVVGAFLVATGGTDDGSAKRSLNTEFREPQKFDLDRVYADSGFNCDSRDTICVRKFLVGVTADYGPRASLPVLERLQREQRVDLSVNDHDLAHAVGRETAKDFGSNFEAFDLCPTIFNYGCSHGFFEYVLARTDTPKDAALTVCETVGGDKNRLLISGFSCYHGVGHGVMMAQAYDLRESLRTCNTFPTHQAQEGCWQGVFMENVNAGMTDRARKGVFTRSNPLAPCDKVATQYKHQCFINHAGWLMRVAQNSVERATGYCLKVRGPDRTACMQSVGLMVTNPVWQANLSPNAAKKSQSTVAWELCSRFPKAGHQDCVIAAVDNLANFDQLNVGREKAFCGEVATGLKTVCYRQIGVNLRGRTQDEAILRARCGALGRNARPCLRGAAIVT